MSEILAAYIENEEAIKRFLRRRGAQSNEIDDFAQETFLRGYAAEMQSEIDEPKAYLFQIARNIVHEKFRKKGKINLVSTEDLDDARLIIDESQAATDEWIDARQKLALLARAVAGLPPRCQKAFLLRRVEELQYKQIANRMNISVSAVEKYVAIGLVKCSAYLTSHGYDPSEFGGLKKRRAKGEREARDAARDDEAQGK